MYHANLLLAAQVQTSAAVPMFRYKTSREASNAVDPQTWQPKLRAKKTAFKVSKHWLCSHTSSTQTSVAVDADSAPSDDTHLRKRGRPTKRSIDISYLDHGRNASGTPKGATPQPKQESVPQASPPALSPPKDAPTKGVKALPTQRDHTTDQLNPEGDEYIVRDTDEAGEQKVTMTGHLRGGREYRCRTFYVPNRGEKLFMLATECARVLVYRDSYLLFNKNRSLHKIIANQVEKDHLINEGILPYSYRSRQIAMVTARSMFRQFGARMITNGRRVRDDYWEYKARKQGFTEDDLASDKRPATNKPKESTSEAAATNTIAMSVLAGNEIRYVDNPLQDPLLLPGAGLGIGSIIPNTLYPMVSSDDMIHRDFGNLRRPRQDITPTPYQDRTQSSTGAEIVNQAAQAAEFNKALRAQGAVRGQLLTSEWNREHHSETPELLQTLPPEDPSTTAPLPPQHTSPQQAMRSHPSMASGGRPSSMISQPHRRSSSAMNNPSYPTQNPYQSQPGIAQSPANIHQPLPGAAQIPGGGSGQPRQSPYAFNSAAAMANNPGLYQYMQQQQQQQAQQQNASMWAGSGQAHTPGPNSTPNPQNLHQSPMHGSHTQLPQQYQGQQHTMSPHMARSPHHPSQGQHPSQLQGSMQSAQSGMQSQPGSGLPNSSLAAANMSAMGGAGAPGMSMGFQNMGAGAMPNNPYATMNRGMFQQPGAGSPQQYMSGGNQGPNMSMYGGSGMGTMNPMQAGGQGPGSQWGGF